MHRVTAQLPYYLIFSLVVLPLIAWEQIPGRAENVEDMDRKEPLSCRAERQLEMTHNGMQTDVAQEGVPSQAERSAKLG